MTAGFTGPTERKRFDEWLAKQPTVRLVCRISGHWWPDSMAPQYLAGKQRRPGTYTTQASCQREIEGENCGTSRHSYISSRDGTIAASSTYSYAPGYLLDSDYGETWSMDRVSRGRVRLELRRRNLTDAGVPA